MIRNFRIDTDTDHYRYERASIATYNNRFGSFWVKWVQENGGMVRCSQVFVFGMRPTRSDVIAAFNGGL